MSLENLIQAARQNASGEGLPPVADWHPENCANMDIRILRNGNWLHEGSPILRPELVKLFASILRKDADGTTWLVTPVEKVKVHVELAHFIAITVDRDQSSRHQDLFFTTNVGDVVRLDHKHFLRVGTNKQTGEPQPLLRVRGRLDALLSRPVFYQLVEWAEERDKQLGVNSAGEFFALGPKGAHIID